MLAFTRNNLALGKVTEFLAHLRAEKIPLFPPDAPRTARDEGQGHTENSPGAGCLHELFEAQVEAKPQATALVDGLERLTYGELNRRANRVAHHLQSLGVGRETLVGIFLERTADMVSGILGVLKAGGAYLPLDPVYPPDRLAFMLEDAQVRTILTQSSLVAMLQGFVPAAGQAPHLVCLDTDRRIPFARAENPRPSAQAHNLAYVIYTSGSTGKPKGVALEHHNAVAFVHWAGQVYSPHELDGVLAGVSICFDLSILDLLAPLSLGGKVILAPNTLALSSLAAAAEVRLITTVPAVGRGLLRIGGIPPSVETINLGGEPLSTQLVQQLYALPHLKRVYELYGPTETTTNSTFALRTPGSPPTLGRPIAGTQVYLWDEQLKPVPVGVTGELYIGGSGVARGYLNRPESTAQKFLQLPLADGQPARLYRTGDLCRYRPDGNLEFVGRRDQQVKIRGCRVELGEIESAIMTHPSVSEAVVIAHEDATGERRLVAYVVPQSTPAKKPATPAAAECRIVPQLRKHVQARLPDYMLPGTFVLLDRFALTPSGKIDRAKLPAPGRTRSGAGEYLAPRTPSEELLCRIWAGLLGLKKIGVNDDFFQLGGDSLLGVAMFAEIEKKTGLKLPVKAMLQTSAVSRLAAVLDEARQSGQPVSDSPWVAVQSQGARPRLFLVHGVGGGMMWGYANLARHLGRDQPIFACKACDPDRLPEFDTIEKMAAHYVEALRRFQPEGPYALGGYCFGGNVAYEMARLLDQQGQRVCLLVLLNSFPTNSGFGRRDWLPLYLNKFLCNLGYWLIGFMQWGPAKQKRFLRWKLGVAKKKVGQWFRVAPRRHSGPAVDELMDLSAVPGDQRRLWESHVRAYANHQTRPYGGKVTLLRTRGHPLNCPYDRQYGWGELARGGVTVRMIPGLHENLLEEPHVRVLARELKVQLDAIQPAAGGSS